MEVFLQNVCINSSAELNPESGFRTETGMLKFVKAS